MENLGLIPIRNFAVVDADKGIYRSAQPMYRYEFQWLKDKLKVNKIYSLRSESNHSKFIGEKYGIEVVNINVKDHHIPTLQQAHEFMEAIKNDRDVLFHCEHGHGRTSTFCVLARLATGWNLNDAIKEETEVYGYQFAHPEQLEFLQQHFSNINQN